MSTNAITPLSDMGAQPSTAQVNDQIQPNDSGQQTQSQPAQVQPAPSTQGMPMRPASTLPTPTPQSPQQSLRSHIFDTILKAGAGQPVQGPDGKPIPMTRGIMGKAIIANALAGIMAGYGTSETVNTRFGPVRVNNPAKAFSAGAQAAQQQQQQRQQQIDDATARKYTALRNNLELMQQQTALSNTALHNQETYNKSLDEVTSNAEPILSDWEQYDEQRGDNEPPAIVARNLTYEQAMQQFHAVNQNAIPDGKVAVRNPQTGQTEFHQTYAIVNPDAKPRLSQASLDMLAKYGIAGYSKLAEIGSTDAVIPVRMVISAINQANTLASAEHFFNHAAQDVFDTIGGKGVASIDLPAAVKNDRTILPVIMTAQKALASGQPTYKILDAIRNSPNGGKLISVIGSPDDIDKYITAKQDEATAEAAKAKVAGQEELVKIRTANQTMTPNKAASILSDPNSAPSDRTRATAFQNIVNNQKAMQKQAQASIDQSVKQGDPQTAGKLLYDGTLTLSELKSRGVTPKFITDATNAGLALAVAHGENDWTPQKSEAQFKNAQSNQNLQFFGSANSLLDPQGTLAQLSAQHARLGNGQIPLFNNWEDYMKYQTGDPALAGFMQTALGVADDYAKVMGGGTGSDTSRLQVMHSFANAYNPQQMQAAISAARNAVQSQVSARIGNNRVMQQMYGQNVPRTQTQPAPTHVFSLSAWQRANPNGDVNAAKTAAQQQGYQVVN
jgi:hypothetical protein